MSYLVLARKHRPQTFAAVIGQTHVTQTLSNAIVADRLAHAILLTGPRGTGKTTIARILAKAMNCEAGPQPQPCNSCQSCSDITAGHATDVFEIDGASNNSVDQVRELRENLQFLPIQSRYKIFIIDEVHMLSLAAFNALLKTLEEPPPHVLFVFATTEPQKIPITILSRCQRHDLRRVGYEALTQHLLSLCQEEGFELSADSLWLIAREADGSVRDALSLLDQVLSGADGTVTDAEMLELLGLIDRKVLFELVDAILAKKLVTILEILESVYQRGQDMRKLYADLVEHFRHLVVLKTTHAPGRLVELPEQELKLMRRQSENQPPAALGQLLELLFQAEAQIRYATQPRLTLEMLFIRLLQARPALAIDTLIEKIDALQQGFPVDPSEGSPPRQQPSGDSITAPASQPQPAGADAHQQTAAPDAIDADPADAQSPDAIHKDPQSAWQALTKAYETSQPALANTLAACQLTQTATGGYTVSVAGNQFAVNKVQKNLGKLQRRLSVLMGTTAVLKIDQAIASDQEAMREKKKEAEALKNRALDHPLVGEVVERFQGEVVEVKLL
ncbi:MAG: DNA polymerase III subunit gamma/tau [Desulfosarcinaceae bacterium]|nr:DNA polymerase III subunit gamma/tau [Desulfosarcinaceae bacterium]